MYRAMGKGANTAAQVPTGALLSAGVILKRSVKERFILLRVFRYSSGDRPLRVD